MNLLLLLPEDESGEVHRIEGPRAKHLLEVLEVRPGRRLFAGELDGPTGTAEVTAVGPGWVEVLAKLDRPSPPAPPGRLLLALPRPKVLRRLLPQLAALGVDEIVLLRTWRVQRSYLDTELLRPEIHRPLLLDGLMQAGLTRLPRVRLEARFRPFVEDRLPSERKERRIVAHPRAILPIGGLPPDPGPYALLVGPEAGLLDGELDLVLQAGFRPARLCAGVLKVETAVVAGLALLDGLRARANP